MRARTVNALLGVWLVLSAFLWTHRVEQFHNAWLIGLLVATMAVSGMHGVPWGRWINALAGAWLLTSSLMWPSSGPTFVNHMLVGTAIVLFAVVPMLGSVRRRSGIGT